MEKAGARIPRCRFDSCKLTLRLTSCFQEVFCLHRLSGQDTALSRRRHGFEPRWRYVIWGGTELSSQLTLSPPLLSRFVLGGEGNFLHIAHDGEKVSSVLHPSVLGRMFGCVAQSGQSSGLQNRRSQVQLLPHLPLRYDVIGSISDFESDCLGSNPSISAHMPHW